MKIGTPTEAIPETGGLCNLKAPFPWFGGKSTVTHIVWQAFGDVRNYVEPFFGSGAMLLSRQQPFQGTETVNDKDGMVSNFWRAIQHDPEQVAQFANHPVNENDLHARHAWLVGIKHSLAPNLEGDPEWYDVKIAGWWVWGICCWIGSGFCSGKGPWQVVDGQLVNLGSAGQGVTRQLSGDDGMTDWFEKLAGRLRYVRVCSGDWTRVCSHAPTVKLGLTAVFLDPPYADTAGRTPNIYREDSTSVAHEVREWAISRGNDPLMRIALCGYDGEHSMPADWKTYRWKAGGGYASLAAEYNDNCERETIWFSPHCVDFNSQPSLFAGRTA